METKNMKTWTPTQDEMKKRIARFKDIVPVARKHTEEKGIPAEVFELITARTTRNIMSPSAMPGQMAPSPHVVGGDAGVFRLGIATCPPGNGPGLHVHFKTHETFMALTGRWECHWGDHEEEVTVLEPFDLLACPPAVARRFINISDADAHLLVIVQGERDEFDDIDRLHSTAQAVAKKYGQEMVEKMESFGWRFNLGRDSSEELHKLAKT